MIHNIQKVEPPALKPVLIWVPKVTGLREDFDATEKGSWVSGALTTDHYPSQWWFFSGPSGSSTGALEKFPIWREMPEAPEHPQGDSAVAAQKELDAENIHALELELYGDVQDERSGWGNKVEAVRQLRAKTKEINDLKEAVRRLENAASVGVVSAHG